VIGTFNVMTLAAAKIATTERSSSVSAA